MNIVYINFIEKYLCHLSYGIHILTVLVRAKNAKKNHTSNKTHKFIFNLAELWSVCVFSNFFSFEIIFFAFWFFPFFDCVDVFADFWPVLAIKNVCTRHNYISAAEYAPINQQQKKFCTLFRSLYLEWLFFFSDSKNNIQRIQKKNNNRQF